MSMIVVYSSHTGFTKRYATWLAEELGCRAVSLDDEPRFDASGFDIVAMGGWLHAGGLAGKKWLVRARERHPQARFVVFAVGATPVEWDDMVAEALAKGAAVAGVRRRGALLPARRVRLRAPERAEQAGHEAVLQDAGEERGARPACGRDALRDARRVRRHRPRRARAGDGLRPRARRRRGADGEARSARERGAPHRAGDLRVQRRVRGGVRRLHDGGRRGRPAARVRRALRLLRPHGALDPADAAACVYDGRPVLAGACPRARERGGEPRGRRAVRAPRWARAFVGAAGRCAAHRLVRVRARVPAEPGLGDLSGDRARADGVRGGDGAPRASGARVRAA